jgi:1,4-dihydroxy-2-naphthoate octaprenyltransferase
MILTPTRSALLHLRIPFSIFLLPVYVFALSQAPVIIPINALIVFIVWHLFVYPASNGYNSYFDKDEGSIALLEKPPVVDKSLYNLSIGLDLIGFLLAIFVSINFAFSVLIYGTLSKLYSHPATRLKKYPIVSFLIVFIFQGAFVYWSSYQAVSAIYNWDVKVIIASLICSCLIGASYPLTQVYQHEEDAKRGDKTLSLMLGIKGSFIFSALLFLLATVFIFIYWYRLNALQNFWLFLGFALPVTYTFSRWFLRVRKDALNANFKNMTTMTITSSLVMLLYFSMIWVLKE